jgi:hypothetical protein
MGATPDKSQLLDKYIYDEISYDGNNLYRVVGQPTQINCPKVPAGAIAPCMGTPEYTSEQDVDLVSRIDCSGKYYMQNGPNTIEIPNTCTIIGDEDVWVG